MVSVRSNRWRVTASWLHSVPRLLPLFFILSAAPVLVFLALATPLGEAPDEAAHIARADSLRHGQIAGSRRPHLDSQNVATSDVVVRADSSLFAVGFELPGGVPLLEKRVTQARIDELLLAKWSNRLIKGSVTNTGVYPPFFYVPATIGLQVGHPPG